MNWIGASTGWFGRNFLIDKEGDKDFIWTPENLGPAFGGINYNVWIDKDGDYNMEGEVWAPNAGSDSFFVEIWRHNADGTYTGYDFGKGTNYGLLTRAHWRFEFAGITYGVWCTIKVNHVDDYVQPKQSINPIVYHLKAGEYLVKITMREDGAKLSKFRFVSSTQPK